MFNTLPPCREQDHIYLDILILGHLYHHSWSQPSWSTPPSRQCSPDAFLARGQDLLHIDQHDPLDHDHHSHLDHEHHNHLNGVRTKCQPDIMPTKGWHFVRTYFCGWHFVHSNFLVGILSGPSQHVLAFWPSHENPNSPPLTLVKRVGGSVNLLLLTVVGVKSMFFFYG